jgi:hypothetical protein
VLRSVGNERHATSSIPSLNQPADTPTWARGARHVRRSSQLRPPSTRVRSCTRGHRAPLCACGFSSFLLNALVSRVKRRMLIRIVRFVPSVHRYKFSEPKMQPYVIMQGINDRMVSRDALAVLAAPEQPRLSNDF